MYIIVGVCIFTAIVVMLLLLRLLVSDWNSSPTPAAMEKEKAEKKIAEKEKAYELWNCFNKWWIGSKFNNFKVVKKYTTLLSNENRYRQVLHQAATDEYFDLSVSTTDYYKFKEGSYICFEGVPRNIPSYTKEIIEEFIKETKFNITVSEFFEVKKTWWIKQ